MTHIMNAMYASESNSISVTIPMPHPTNKNPVELRFTASHLKSWGCTHGE